MGNFFKILVFCLSIFSTVHAQEFFRLKESMGMPLRSRSYADLKGSPYFLDSWNKGVIKQSNGQSFKDVDLKYDQLEDDLIFKDSKGQELGFAIPVSEFKIDYVLNGVSKTSLFRNGFEPFKGSTERNFYEILYDGHVKLVKKNVKRIEQSREYNSATITKSVISRIKYYYYTTNILSEFKRDNKSLIATFGKNSDKVINYIQESKLDLKSDEDLIKLFSYYASL